MLRHNWIDLTQDADTGIETLRAHFEGHAYDPHWHDSYLVGVTEQGVQQFHCRRAKHQCTPGKVFLPEPGDIHDGEAPTEAGFTYRMLYLDPHWLERELSAVFENSPDNCKLSFANTLTSDVRLAHATSLAFAALHDGELKIVRQTALDGLLERLTSHLHWRTRYGDDPRLPRVAQKAREYLHANARYDIGLDQLAAVTGVDSLPPDPRFQGGLWHCAPRVSGAIAPGHGPSNAGPWKATGDGGHGAWVCRPESSGALVRARLRLDAGAVSQALLKSSRQVSPRIVKIVAHDLHRSLPAMLSSFPALLPFLLFAFVASITPGPTNILVLSNSARYRLAAAVPIILGAGASAATIVLLVGAGAGSALTSLPLVQITMQWIGVAWLSYLTWQIFSAPAVGIATQKTEARLGLVGAASLQLIHPKTWMMALAVVSVFAGGGEQRLARVALLSLVFFLVSLPCLGVWALLGAGSTRWLRSPQAMQRFNRCMALLLLVSAWSSVLA